MQGNQIRRAIGPSQPIAFEVLDEFFTRSGRLLGFEYAKMHESGKLDTAYFWAGKPASSVYWRDKKLELYHSISKGRRAP